MRGTVPWSHIYINLHTKRKVTSWYLVKGQLIYISLWPWLTKPSEGASRHPVRIPFVGITTESRTFVCWDRVSIHLATTWNSRSARPQQLHHIFYYQKYNYYDQVWCKSLYCMVFAYGITNYGDDELLMNSYMAIYEILEITDKTCA